MQGPELPGSMCFAFQWTLSLSKWAFLNLLGRVACSYISIHMCKLAVPDQLVSY